MRDFKFTFVMAWLLLLGNSRLSCGKTISLFLQIRMTCPLSESCNQVGLLLPSPSKLRVVGNVKTIDLFKVRFTSACVFMPTSRLNIINNNIVMTIPGNIE